MADLDDSKLPESRDDVSHNSNSSSCEQEKQSDPVIQPVKMSKNQMKKLAKKQRKLEIRPLKRKLEKEKKKVRRKEMFEKMIANGESLLQFKLMAESSNKFRVVIDMDFEEYMTDYEISQAARQVNLIYGLNRRSKNPCQLYVSSLTGERLEPIFAKVNKHYDNWDVNVSEKDYLSLFDHESNETGANKLKEQIIYLSADADEALPTTEALLQDESKIFIIGGLVDHNRHKNLCHRLATERQIKTARLPLKENNVHLSQRHIFSTVTVFQIMLNVLSLRMSWSEAMITAIPKRKLANNPSEDKTSQPTQLNHDDAAQKSSSVEPLHHQDG